MEESNKALAEIHKAELYKNIGLKEEEVSSYVAHARQIERLIPQGNSFYAVVNLTTYTYDFLGEGQQLLTGHDNEVVKGKGPQFQMENIHPEDGQILLEEGYQKLRPLLQKHGNKSLKLVLQSNYRFKHAQGYYMHLYEQIWPLKASSKGELLMALLHIHELPMLTPFRIKVTAGIFGNQGSFEELFSNTFPKNKQILSAREMEVLSHVTKGLSSTDIAKELNLSYHTVRAHRRNILEKLKLKNTQELITYALTHDLNF